MAARNLCQLKNLFVSDKHFTICMLLINMTYSTLLYSMTFTFYDCHAFFMWNFELDILYWIYTIIFTNITV